MAVPVPGFRILVDGRDITADVRPRLVSLSLTERRDGSADQLDLVLDDSDGRLAIPPDGATVTLSIGWASGPRAGLVDKGRFKVDSAGHSGPADRVTLSARSADLTGKYRVRRERSWTDTTLGEVLGEIAGDNGLDLRLDPDLEGIEIPALASHEKSDMALVRELGRRYDAVATVKAGALIFSAKGKGKTTRGAALPDLVITRSAGDRHDWRRAARDRYDGAEARWHDQDSGERQTVYAGGGKRRRLRRVYHSKASAQAAADASARRVARASATLDIDLALGDATIYPDRPCAVSGFKAEIDAMKWLVTEVSHEISKRGFTTRLQLETR